MRPRRLQALRSRHGPSFVPQMQTASASQTVSAPQGGVAPHRTLAALTRHPRGSCKPRITNTHGVVAQAHTPVIVPRFRQVLRKTRAPIGMMGFSGEDYTG
jgi:hypothetical protein